MGCDMHICIIFSSLIVHVAEVMICDGFPPASIIMLID